jgi:flagellar basal body-associated protein FliL
MILRFLLIAILVLYVIRLIARWLLPVLFQNMVNKATQQQQNYQQPKKPEGVIRVDYVPQNQKGTIPDSAGEFVDYEEIK